MADLSDKSVLRHVNQRLARLGGAQGKVTASVARGTVTLSGTIQFEMQRNSIVKVATSVPGVRTVSDQLKLKPKERPANPTRPYVPKVPVAKTQVVMGEEQKPSASPAAATIVDAPK